MELCRAYGWHIFGNDYLKQNWRDEVWISLVPPFLLENMKFSKNFLNPLREIRSLFV